MIDYNKCTIKQIKEVFPNVEHDSWCSDLYVKHTPEIFSWLKNNLQFPKNMTTFINRIDKSLWIDIPFHYTTEYYNR